MRSYEQALTHVESFTFHQNRENIPEALAKRLDYELLIDAATELTEALDAGEVDVDPFIDAIDFQDTQLSALAHAAPSLVDLSLSLRSQVYGQDTAIGAVAERVTSSLSGLKLHPERPHAVILLNGPTGTGKTTLARGLAQAAYADPDAMIRLDMSEYADAADARMKLIGASRIWKNSTTEGLLTTRVAQKPNSVIVLDEFEKSHPDIWPLFLQVFDEGRLTDGWGTEVSFANTIIVLTTNLGPDTPAGVPEDVFTSEFLGRIDVNVTFEPLSADAIRQIVHTELGNAITRAKSHGWELVVHAEVGEWVTQKAIGTGSGARGIQRDIEKCLLTPLIAFDKQQVTVTVNPSTNTLILPL